MFLMYICIIQECSLTAIAMDISKTSRKKDNEIICLVRTYFLIINNRPYLKLLMLLLQLLLLMKMLLLLLLSLLHPRKRSASWCCQRAYLIKQGQICTAILVACGWAGAGCIRIIRHFGKGGDTKTPHIDKSDRRMNWRTGQKLAYRARLKREIQ